LQARALPGWEIRFPLHGADLPAGEVFDDEWRMIPTRRLGKTELELPIISFGASSLGQEFRNRLEPEQQPLKTLQQSVV